MPVDTKQTIRYTRSNRQRLTVFFFFFFQAEDGIRDWSVTGVQTCALPLYLELGGSNVSLHEN